MEREEGEVGRKMDGEGEGEGVYLVIKTCILLDVCTCKYVCMHACISVYVCIHVYNNIIVNMYVCLCICVRA